MFYEEFVVVCVRVILCKPQLVSKISYLQKSISIWIAVILTFELSIILNTMNTNAVWILEEE